MKAEIQHHRGLEIVVRIKNRKVVMFYSQRAFDGQSILYSGLLCIFIYFISITSSWAESPRVFPVGQLPHDRRLEPLEDLDGYFPSAPPASREVWKKRAAKLRRQVLVAAGLWPMPTKTPLNAVIYGTVYRDKYTVDKVYLESYKGFFVTGNLYRPKGYIGKLPAVLCPHGHWPNGRFNDTGPVEIRKQIVAGAERFELSGRYPLQARCVQLARMGCVVFHYDMVGYADSKQLSHRAGIRPKMNSQQKWGLFSPQAEARLQTIFGLQTYNSIRALDFLCTLPYVDPSRIGVTGASGGGTQTFILAAIDPRPAVIFPAVMVSAAMQGGCPCENASYLRIGTGNIELVGLFAPKPLGMTAADDWTRELCNKGLPELKQLYKLFNKEDSVMAKPLLQFPHNYNYVSRAVMYAWFNKHLHLGLEEPIVEEDFCPLSISEMTVWNKQHPVPPRGLDFERSLLQRMTNDSRRQIEALAPKDAASFVEYQRIVGGAVEAMIGRGLPMPGELEMANSQSQNLRSHQMTKFILRYPSRGEELPAIYLQPATWNQRLVIWVDRLGKQGMWTPSGELRLAISTLLDKGFAILAADLFGQGEFTSDGNPIWKAKMNENKHAPASDSWGHYAGFTFGYNRAIFVQRVHDLLSLVAFAHSDSLGAERVDLIGLRGAGHWVAAARAIAGSAIDRAAIDTSEFRFANILTMDDPDFLPGGAKYNDLPGMIALSAPNPLWLANESDSAITLISTVYDAVGKIKTWQSPKERQRTRVQGRQMAIEGLLVMVCKQSNSCIRSVPFMVFPVRPKHTLF